MFRARYIIKKHLQIVNKPPIFIIKSKNKEDRHSKYNTECPMKQEQDDLKVVFVI